MEVLKSNASSRAHGIVLAGAYRGGPCVLDPLVPRPLLPVAEQPLITYALRWMATGGLRGAAICANTDARPIGERLGGAACGLRLEYLEDWSPRGAAGCVRDAGVRTDATTFVVADGTSVPVVSLGELLEAHRAARAVVTVVVGGGRAGRLQPSGVYVFDRRAFLHIPEDGFQDIKERLIPRLYAAGETVSTHAAESLAPRVVDADSYLALNHWAVERACVFEEMPDGFRGAGGAILHETASVDPTARLLGPVLVGPGATVQSDATLVGPVSIGRGTEVGRGAVVSRSVLWSECRVGSRSFVDRSLLADRAVVEPASALIHAVRTEARREARHLAVRASRAPWASILGALKPAIPSQG
jgi:NDP-sugar pyrophosphorylase family protein